MDPINHKTQIITDWYKVQVGDKSFGMVVAHQRFNKKGVQGGGKVITKNIRVFPESEMSHRIAMVHSIGGLVRSVQPLQGQNNFLNRVTHLAVQIGRESVEELCVSASQREEMSTRHMQTITSRVAADLENMQIDPSIYFVPKERNWRDLVGIVGSSLQTLASGLGFFCKSISYSLWEFTKWQFVQTKVYPVKINNRITYLFVEGINKNNVFNVTYYDLIDDKSKIENSQKERKVESTPFTLEKTIFSFHQLSLTIKEIAENSLNKEKKSFNSISSIREHVASLPSHSVLLKLYPVKIGNSSFYVMVEGCKYKNKFLPSNYRIFKKENIDISNLYKEDGQSHKILSIKNQVSNLNDLENKIRKNFNCLDFLPNNKNYNEIFQKLTSNINLVRSVQHLQGKNNFFNAVTETAAQIEKKSIEEWRVSVAQREKMLPQHTQKNISHLATDVENMQIDPSTSFISKERSWQGLVGTMGSSLQALASGLGCFCKSIGSSLWEFTKLQFVDTKVYPIKINNKISYLVVEGINKNNVFNVTHYDLIDDKSKIANSQKERKVESTPFILENPILSFNQLSIKIQEIEKKSINKKKTAFNTSESIEKYFKSLSSSSILMKLYPVKIGNRSFHIMIEGHQYKNKFLPNSYRVFRKEKMDISKLYMTNEKINKMVSIKKQIVSLNDLENKIKKNFSSLDFLPRNQNSDEIFRKLVSGINQDDICLST